VNLVKTRK